MIRRSPLPAALRTALLAFALACLPSPAAALFHLARISEVQTSNGGDPLIQFVEIEMTADAQSFVSKSVLASFDGGGHYIEDVLVVPGNVANAGVGVRWIMGTQGFQAATGVVPDFVIPARLPTGAGMICWGAPGLVPPADPSSWDHTDPENYIDCIAYGGYAGPTNSFIGDPTPFDPHGHALQRVAETHDSATDFDCVAIGDPTNNAGSSFALQGTDACTLDASIAGELELRIGGAPPVVVPGSGPALVSTSGPGLRGSITGLAIPAGLFATAVTVPIPNAFSLVEMRLGGPGASGPFQNQGISVQSGGTCTAGHPNVTCAGGGLAGSGGLSGSALFAFLDTASQIQNLSLPLSVVGGGSTTNGQSTPFLAAISGAGWTTGGVSVEGSVLTSAGSRQTDPSRTTFTGERITLVSPVEITAGPTGAPVTLPTVARIQVTLPEPATPLLVATALSAVAGLALSRRRRR